MPVGSRDQSLAGAVTVQHLCLHLCCSCILVKSYRKEMIYEADLSFMSAEWSVLAPTPSSWL